jgi:hypothetical protein
MNLNTHEKTIRYTLSPGFTFLNLGNVSTAAATSFIDSSAKKQYDNIAKNCVALASFGTFDGIKSASRPSSGLGTSIIIIISIYLIFYTNSNSNSNSNSNKQKQKIKLNMQIEII